MEENSNKKNQTDNNNTKQEEINKGNYYKASTSVQLFSFIAFLIVLLFLFRNPITKFETNDPSPYISQLTPKKIISFGGSPSDVYVGIHIKDIPQFDIIHGKFVLDLTVWFSFDHRLISLKSIGKFTFDRAKIIEKSKPYIQIEGNNIIARYDVKAEFNTTLNYDSFPLDDHTINFSLTNYQFSPSEINFKSSIIDFIVNPNIQTSGWTWVDKSIRTGFLEDKIQTQKERKKHHPRIIFSLDFARTGVRHIVTIILPLLLIFFIATFTFSFNPFGRNKGNIIKISIAAITAVIAHRFIIDNISPDSGSFMLSDYFFFFFLLGCCIIFILNLFHDRISGFYKNIITIAIYLCYILAFSYVLSQMS